MPTKFPIFDQRYAINSLTAALEGGEYGTPPSLSDAEALVLEQYRADFLQRGFLVSVAMGAAAFVKMDPFWILHKPRQWGKLGRLSAIIGGIGALGLSTVSAVTAQECSTALLTMPRTEVTQRLRLELYKQNPSQHSRP